MQHKIAMLGDFNPAYSTHHALNKSIDDIKTVLQETVQFDWTGTDTFDAHAAFGDKAYSGLWIVPGSPYNSDLNVLNAIEYTRKNNIPTLGNCGGFQYMLIEFAKNVCGIEHAGHEETNPVGPELLITKLSCSLVEQEEELTVPHKNSLLYKITGKEKVLGRYYCNYGLNDAYAEILQSHGLTYTAISPGKQVRAFELRPHPFFMGTLFQPALTSSAEAPNPILISFVKQSMGIQ